MTFIFKDYRYDAANKTAWFEYEHDNGHTFRETMQFDTVLDSYNDAVLERALFLAFLLVGTSYWKCFPSPDVEFQKGTIDEWQANFVNIVYQEGMSQFAFENNLSRNDLAHFAPSSDGIAVSAVPYKGEGILSLQSGGKDSLLVAQLLEEKGVEYAPWYISNGPSHPVVLDQLARPLSLAHRVIDRAALMEAQSAGGKNGHVPVTFIVLAYALVQAILGGKMTVLTAIAHEGDEAHEWIGDLPVNHQWSKTWHSEQLFSQYVKNYISPDIKVGSPLRNLTELKVAELFTDAAWSRFGSSFSSCNMANYQQGADNTKLTWCGHCPKCANSYLLFAPFVNKNDLDERIGKDLFKRPELTETFKGLLGIDGVMKPFECVGETDELRAAYHLALCRGYEQLPFEVPDSAFDKDRQYEAQEWATEMLQ